MKTTLVFLHGLLGTQADWKKLSENLPHFDCIALDLPWHGSAKNYPVQDFDETCAYVAKQIQRAVGNQPYFFSGLFPRRKNCPVLRPLQPAREIQPARLDH